MALLRRGRLAYYLSIFLATQYVAYIGMFLGPTGPIRHRATTTWLRLALSGPDLR